MVPIGAAIGRKLENVVASGDRAGLAAFRRAVQPLDDAAVARLALAPVADKPLEGASAKVMARDVASGRRFIFKPAVPGNPSHAVDQMAIRLKQAASEPTYQSVARKLTLADGRAVDGYVKPIWTGVTPLAADSTRWSPEVRAQLLADAPWTRILGDVDNHPGQYLQVDATHQLVNVDRDMSLTGYASAASMDRFARQRVAYPGAQELLFDDYVNGRTQLDFKPLFEEVKRIQALPDDTIRSAVRPAAEAWVASGKSGEMKSADEVVNAMLARKQTLRTDFQGLVQSLQKERAWKAGRGGTAPSVASDLREARLAERRWYYTSPLRQWADALRRKVTGLMSGLGG